MKSLSFLDTVCCALMVMIILFQLQSGGPPGPEAAGQALFAFVEVANDRALEGEEVRFQFTVIRAGRPDPGQSFFRGREVQPEKVESLRGGLQVRLPPLDPGKGPHRLIPFEIAGPLPPGAKLEVRVLQASEEVPNRELLDNLQALGLDAILQRFKPACPGLLNGNLRGLPLAVGRADRKPSPESDRAVREWLKANHDEIVLDSRNIGFAPGSVGVAPGPIDPATAFEQLRPYWTDYLTSALHARKAVTRMPAVAVQQEVALNACLVRALTGQPFSLDDLKSLFPREMPGPAALRGGFLLPEQLYTQLFHFLESESDLRLAPGVLTNRLLDGASVARLSLPGQNPAWETAWFPNNWPHDEIVYTPLRARELGEQLKQRMKEGRLIGTADDPRAATAHGRLFYQMCLNRLRVQRIRAVVFQGSRQFTLDGKLRYPAARQVEFILEIDEDQLR